MAVPIAIMISGRGSNMAALIEACKGPDYPARVSAVIADKSEAKGLEIAAKAGIRAVAIERKDYASKASHEAAILAELEKNPPQLICLAGYMRILSAEFVARYEGKILNIHPSLLPKYPGLNTHARALKAGDREHGCTVHFVTAQLDGGLVVARAVVKIDAKDNETTLAQKVLAREHGLYVSAVEKVLRDGV